MKTTSFFCVIVVSIHSLIVAQEDKVVLTHRSFIGDYEASIPNPDSLLGIAAFAHNRSVATELGMTPTQSEKLWSFIQKSGGGSLDSPALMFSLNTKGLKYAELRSVIPPGELLQSAMDAQFLENAENVKSLFSKQQIRRLFQLVFHIEISRVGFAEATIDGFFGKKIGIKDEQKYFLQERANAIEAKLSEAIKNVKIEARRSKELFDGLPELAKQLDEVLGEPFVFYPERNDVWNELSIGLSKYVPAIPDPEDHFLSFPLVLNRSVTRELRINKDDLDTIRQILEVKNRHSSLFVLKQRELSRKQSHLKMQDALAETRKQTIDQVLEVLDPLQVDRFKQVLYQIEIERVGLSEAISKGFLGRKINCTEEEKRRIETQSIALDKKVKATLYDLRRKSLEEFLKELEPSQLVETKDLLGASFEYREEYNSRERIRSR